MAQVTLGYQKSNLINFMSVGIFKLQKICLLKWFIVLLIASFFLRSTFCCFHKRTVTHKRLHIVIGSILQAIGILMHCWVGCKHKIEISCHLDHYGGIDCGAAVMSWIGAYWVFFFTPLSSKNCTVSSSSTLRGKKTCLDPLPKIFPDLLPTLGQRVAAAAAFVNSCRKYWCSALWSSLLQSLY